MKSQYTYAVSSGYARGAFNVYQGRDGRVYILMGNHCIRLTLQQILHLNIDLFSLVDYDHDAYLRAYFTDNKPVMSIDLNWYECNKILRLLNDSHENGVTYSGDEELEMKIRNHRDTIESRKVAAIHER